MSNFVTSLIRTYVPIAVGAVASWLISRGLELDADTQAGLIVAMTGVLQAAYYALARWIEKKFPQVGTILLGSSKAPVYREKQ